MAHKTFLQSLGETPIGNLPATTFRPTEAEKLVLLNVDDMTQQGRSVTQQDAINVPEEKLKDKELNKDQLESAFKQLINIGLIQVEPNQTIVIGPQAQSIIEELRKAEQQEAENEPQQPQGMEMPPDMGMGSPEMGMPGGPTGATQGGGAPMESLEFLRYCNDLSKLLEDAQPTTFTVYKVEGKHIPETYYGYCQGNDEEAIRQSFMNHKSGEEGRGVVQLIRANGGPEGLSFEVVDVVEDEEKAMMRRNEYREEDEHSVTGPSFFPANTWKGAQTKYPELYKQHQERVGRLRTHKNAKTARELFDVYGKEKLQQLASQHGRQAVLGDLDSLRPRDFEKKYGLQISV